MSMTYRSDAFPVCSMWKKLQTKCHSSSTYPKAQCIIRDDDFISWLHLKNCTHWRKAKQMQPMWICIFSGRPFKDTLKNATNVTTREAIWGHMKIHSREKLNKCNQCDFASSRAGDLGRHLETHRGEKSNKCNQCDYASSQAGHM